MQSLGGAATSQAAASESTRTAQPQLSAANALEDEQTGPAPQRGPLSSLPSFTSRPSKSVSKAVPMTARKSLNAQVLAQIVAVVKRTVPKKSLEPFRVRRNGSHIE